MKKLTTHLLAVGAVASLAGGLAHGQGFEQPGGPPMTQPPRQAQPPPPPPPPPPGMWGYAGDADNLHAGEPYVGADLGPAFQENLYIRNAGRSVGIDGGVRADIFAGVNLADQLAVEFQTGVIDNAIRSGGTPLFGGNRAYLDQVPLMGNIIFKAPLLYGITPYIGGGAGGVVSELSVRQFNHWTSDGDITFAYQGLAGVNVAIGRHMEVGLGYRLLGTMDHVWFADDPTMYTPTGKTISHSAVATFTFIF